MTGQLDFKHLGVLVGNRPGLLSSLLFSKLEASDMVISSTALLSNE